MLPLSPWVTWDRLTLFGLCFLICRDLNEMILCSFYRRSLPAYSVVDTTLNPRGIKMSETWCLPSGFVFVLKNNPGSLLHVLKTLFRFRVNRIDFSDLG